MTSVLGVAEAEAAAFLISSAVVAVVIPAVGTVEAVGVGPTMVVITREPIPTQASRA